MTGKKHIAIITNGGVYSGYRAEGTPALTNLLRELAKEYKLTVFSLTSAKPDVAPFKLIPVKGRGYLKYWDLYLRLKTAHRENPISLIHGYFGWPAGFLAVFFSKIFSIPSIQTLMGGESADFPEINFGLLGNPLLKRLVFWSIKKASVTVVLSRYQLNSLASHGLKPSQSIKVIPFGVPLKDVSKKVGVKLTYQLVSVGNINLIKNHKMMIKALKTLNKRMEVHLTIVGGDYLDSQIQNFVQAEGMSDYVTFTGQVSNEMAVAHIAAADGLVIASYSESLSVVFVEAMSVGTPVCSTPVGLMKDLADTHCLVCDIDDHEQMSDQLQRLLTNDELKERLIRNGKAWAGSHDADYTLTEYTLLYDQLMPTHP
ncbi:MAG: hypothetical protein Roseis3KO_01790 [Roseivirga sp.]